MCILLVLISFPELLNLKNCMRKEGTVFRPSIPLIFLCAGAANRDLRQKQQMTVHHSGDSASSWRMGIVFVAKFRSDTATLTSTFQGGFLLTPCSCVPGSPYISVALRV